MWLIQIYFPKSLFFLFFFLLIYFRGNHFPQKVARLKRVSAGGSVVSRSCGHPGHHVLTTCSCVRLSSWWGSLSSPLPSSRLLPWIQLSCIMQSDARRRNQLVVKLCRVNTSSPYRYWHSFQSFEPAKKNKKNPKHLRWKSGGTARANYDETNPNTVVSLIIAGLSHVEY